MAIFFFRASEKSITPTTIRTNDRLNIVLAIRPLRQSRQHRARDMQPLKWQPIPVGDEAGGIRAGPETIGFIAKVEFKLSAGILLVRPQRYCTSTTSATPL